MLSPVGKVSFAKLDEPDTRFSQDGVYSITLEIPPEDSKEFLIELDSLMKKSLEVAKSETGNKRIKAASIPYELLEDQTVKLRFKMRASGIGLNGERWSKKPEVFDADLNLIEPFVPTGSTARVSFIPANFYTSLMGSGISLRLTAVQVKDLINIHPVTYKYGFTPL
jgi:hypothetical protein